MVVRSADVAVQNHLATKVKRFLQIHLYEVYVREIPTISQ